MSYIALYRKFRPQFFDDVVGQEHITQTLKNQVKNNRVGHAYLFNGGRGSGKTTTAKILSRAVNCLNPINGEPCNECENCRGILDGSIMDVIEMDAASNNGVDNIRSIREEVEYLPAQTRYRVYIIDEVHMLSTGAFNALLKTLEEPPAHVIFILATTEPQKIPLTILSRCQRFEFKKISIENIKQRLEYICKETGVSIEDKACLMIAKLSGGAMRDAISLLDRCISDGDENITEEKIRLLTGISKFEYLANMCEDLITSNTEKVLVDAEELIKEGKDLNVFIDEMIGLVRDMLILLACSSIETYNNEEINVLKRIIGISNKEELLQLISELFDISNKMRYTTNSEIVFETGLIKICANMEKYRGNLSVNQEHRAILSDDETDSFNNKVLTKLRENGKMLVHANLAGSKIEIINDDMVHITFNDVVDDFKKSVLQKEENKMAIKEAIVAVVGKNISVRYVFLK